MKAWNESTAGADASVEIPKLHNIKLLIAYFYTHDENFFIIAACKLKEWVRIDRDCC